MAFTRYAEHQSYVPSSPLVILNWYVKKAKLKKKYPFLNDEDLLYEEGKESEMYENLQVKLDLSREELQKIFEEN